jgi:hypothetical protein
VGEGRSGLSVFVFLEEILGQDAASDDKELSLAKLVVGGGGGNFAQFKAMASHGALRASGY